MSAEPLEKRFHSFIPRIKSRWLLLCAQSVLGILGTWNPVPVPTKLVGKHGRPFPWEGGPGASSFPVHTPYTQGHCPAVSLLPRPQTRVPS